MANTHGLRYQTLLKSLLEEAVSRAEQGGLPTTIAAEDPLEDESEETESVTPERQTSSSQGVREALAKLLQRP